MILEKFSNTDYEEEIILGGYGSGFNGIAKETVNQCFQLDVSAYARNGIIRPGFIFNGTITFSHNEYSIIANIIVNGEFNPPRITIYNETNSINDTITLTTSVPHFGGVRWWFLCPGCNRRVGKLYLKLGCFRCRHCLDLTYKSSQEAHRSDALFKACPTYALLKRLERKIGRKKLNELEAAYLSRFRR